ALPCVPKRREPEIVPGRDCLGQLFMKTEDFGDRARDLRHLERVSQAGPVMVAGGVGEELRFMGWAGGGLPVEDARAMPPRSAANAVVRLRVESATRVGALGRLRCQGFPFPSFQFLANARWALGVRLGSGPIAHLALLLVPGDGSQETGSIRKAADVEQFGK